MKTLRYWLAGLIFALVSPPAPAQTTDPAPHPQCVGVTGTYSDLDKQVEDLEATVARLRAAIPPGADDTPELREAQEELLDLLFARECKRPDMRIATVRGPNDTPPRWVEVTTFYATDRKPTGNSDPMQFYGGDRWQNSQNAPTVLQYGRALVSIPTNRQPGSLPLPSLWKFELSADPAKHFILKSVNPIGADAVRNEMAAAVAGNAQKSALVFVHGYNVAFADAALRTAQIAHDLSFAGIPVFFSWPSLGTTRGYWHDEETVQLSLAAFDSFLDTLGSIGVTEIYLIAHSMGNRLVTSVLRDRSATNRLPANLRELMLAAPDINEQIFREIILPSMAALQGVHRTIYASSNDVALRASKAVHEYRRVGETDGGVLTFTGFETIDASGVAPILRAFGHSYVMDSAKVLGDIAEVLSLHFTADQRNLPRQGTPPAAWWVLR
jgi:esterase/lipase superfamily enzyme